MIFYNPISGLAEQFAITSQPKKCFIMTQLGQPIPTAVLDIRKKLMSILSYHGIEEIDATSVVTGKDILYKIWCILISLPLGIAIIDETMSSNTVCNIFYEIGLMQTLGKETIVIKTKKAKVPSDFVRTEYIKFDSEFERSIEKYLRTYESLPEYYETMADNLERNPLLTIAYLRRAYLISGNDELKRKAKKILKQAQFKKRAKNSVEQLFVNF